MTSSNPQTRPAFPENRLETTSKDRAPSTTTAINSLHLLTSQVTQHPTPTSPNTPHLLPTAQKVTFTAYLDNLEDCLRKQISSSIRFNHRTRSLKKLMYEVT